MCTYVYVYIYMYIFNHIYIIYIYRYILYACIYKHTCKRDTSTNYRTICIGFPIAHGNSFVSPQGHHLVLRLACDTEETWERNAKGDEHWRKILDLGDFDYSTEILANQRIGYDFYTGLKTRQIWNFPARSAAAWAAANFVFCGFRFLEISACWMTPTHPCNHSCMRQHVPRHIRLGAFWYPARGRRKAPQF